MKNVFKLFGIITFAAVIVFSMTGCGGSDTFSAAIFSLSSGDIGVAAAYKE